MVAGIWFVPSVPAPTVAPEPGVTPNDPAYADCDRARKANALISHFIVRPPECIGYYKPE